MPDIGFPGVIDVYYKTNMGPQAAQRLAAAGVIAIIHKATEATDFKDPEYHDRKKALKDKFLWGSYHLTSSQDVLKQVDHYLKWAGPEADELVAIDYEKSKYHGEMSFSDLEEMVEILHRELGRYPVIYGGHSLREKAKDVQNSIVSSCPLWYARYLSKPLGVPKLWADWTLWQYTDGADGPEPKAIKGFGRPDRDAYNGTEAQLRQAWPL